MLNRSVIMSLALLITGCQLTSSPYIHESTEPPSKEYIVFIDTDDLKKLQNGEALSLPLTWFDESKGYRVDLPAKIFVRGIFGQIAIFLPPTNPPYRTPENPVPSKKK